MDHASFRLFYDKTMPTLRAYAMRSSGSIEYADDLVQEAFLRFLRSAPVTLTEPQQRSYLYRIVENLIIARWHDSQREQRTAQDSFNESTTAQPKSITTDMERLFSQLDPKQRSLLWLAYVEGFDHKEIAAAANVKEKSVRVLLFRARQTFMDILKRAGLAPEGK